MIEIIEDAETQLYRKGGSRPPQEGDVIEEDRVTGDWDPEADTGGVARRPGLHLEQLGLMYRGGRSTTILSKLTMRQLY